MCRNGLHACSPEALSRWLHDELWHVELDAPEIAQEGVLVARRGRLVERVAAWNDELRHEFAHWCSSRARALAEQRPGEKIAAMVGYVDQITGETPVDAPLVAFCTAKAAAEADPDGAPGERGRQSAWLVERLEL